jgi:hypothetical protein
MITLTCDNIKRISLYFIHNFFIMFQVLESDRPNPETTAEEIKFVPEQM